MRRRFRSGISASSGLGLSSLSRDELDSIHYATLQILQDTGIKIMSENALEVFHGGGATVERHEGFGIVSIPPYLVEESALALLKKCILPSLAMKSQISTSKPATPSRPPPCRTKLT